MSYSYTYFHATDGKRPEIEKIVDKLLLPFGGINDSDKDDFYSLAGIVFVKVENSYDASKGIPFKAYLTSCLSNKIKEAITARNAYKRTAQRDAMSLSTPIQSDSEEIEIGDTISDSKTEVENKIFENILSDRVTEYLSRLTKKQRKVAELIMKGAEESDIMRIMHIGYPEYQRLMSGMRDYEVASILGKREE